MFSVAKKFKFQSEKAKQKWKLFNYTDDIIDSDAVKGPHIEVFGNGEIIIEGCMGVFEYSDTYLKLKLSRGYLIICGFCFDIVSFENSTITIKGKISAVEFCI